MADDVLGEGLLASGLIRLFGRPFTGLTLGDFGASPVSNDPLAVALRQPGVKPSLIRVYAFSYLGTYTKLPEPQVFLVFSEGKPVASGADANDVSADIFGAENFQDYFTEGVRMWTADQLDIAIRIDIRIGWMQDLLAGTDSRRADLVGRDGNLVGRDGNLVGRDGNLVGRDGNLIGRGR